MSLQQSVPHADAPLHALTVDGIQVVVVGRAVGQRPGELTERRERMIDGIEWRGGYAVQTAFGEEGQRDNHLTGRGTVLIEGGQLVGSLHQIVVGDDHAVVKLAVKGTVGGDAQYFHHEGIGAGQARLQLFQLCSNVAEGIGFFLTHVVEHDGDVVAAPSNC